MSGDIPLCVREHAGTLDFAGNFQGLHNLPKQLSELSCVADSEGKGVHLLRSDHIFNLLNFNFFCTVFSFAVFL
jgi:hypothetical protein